MPEVMASVMLQRHDLVAVQASQWRAWVASQPEDTRAYWLREWACRDRPVIVRRDDCEGSAGGLGSPDGAAVGIPLPPSCGKLRIALQLPAAASARHLPAVPLARCRNAAPRHWASLLDRLEALGDATAVEPGVCGSLLWQHLTGLLYLHDASDIDVLWRVTSVAQARAIAAALPGIERGAGLRVDGEILSPGGWGIHWREFESQAPMMLVKTRCSVRLRSQAEVFEHLDAAP